MESVPFFMRHGDAIEHERQQQSQQWAESGSGALKRNPFKMYSDTLGIVRYDKTSGGGSELINMIIAQMFTLESCYGNISGNVLDGTHIEFLTYHIIICGLLTPTQPANSEKCVGQ